MKYGKLHMIVLAKAMDLHDYGMRNNTFINNGCCLLLEKLSRFRSELIRSHNIKIGEHWKVNVIEVGEPEVFKQEINEYKLKK